MSKYDDLVAQERARDQANRDQVNAQVTQQNARRLSATRPFNDAQGGAARAHSHTMDVQDHINRQLLVADGHNPNPPHQVAAEERARDEQNRNQVMAQVAAQDARVAGATAPVNQANQQANAADTQVANAQRDIRRQQNRAETSDMRTQVERTRVNQEIEHANQQSSAPRAGMATQSGRGSAPQMHNPTGPIEQMWEWLTD